MKRKTENEWTGTCWRKCAGESASYVHRL